MQVSIVNYSKLDSRNLRLEAEFYTSDKIIDTTTLFGEEIIAFVQYGTSKELNQDNRGYPVLRLNEYESYFIKEPTKYCEKIDFETYSSLKLQSGDVMICRTNGNPRLVGKSAIVMEDSEYAFASYLYRVRPKQDIISSATLMIYLNSNYGRGEIEKYLMVSNQANFSPAKFREIKVPIFGKLSDKINTLVKSSYDSLKKSKKFYSQADGILLNELGLSNWQAEHKLSFVKNYSEAEQAGRFDAEYFQPKYDEIVQAIKNYRGASDMLGSLVSVRKCVEVGRGEYQDEGVPFVRVSNLSPFEITKEKYISEKLYFGLKQHQPKQGEILFSKDATPGIAYYLRNKPKKMIPSGGILRLKRKDGRINEDYLTLVLNSLLTKEQVNRDVGGSVILHWRPDQVKQILIPILSKEKQEQIQQKVTESFNLRKQSKHLLECAKKAVEMAIEKDEKTAVQWMESEINT